MEICSQSKEEMSGHSFLECRIFESSYRWQADNLRYQISPDDNSCCFTCFLPTRLCRGELRQENSECFSPELLLGFWVVCPLAIEAIRKAKLTDPTLSGGWEPEGWRPRDFTKEEWRLDTEIIEAAWVFLGFAKQYWKLYRFN
jgi:hypothetical protein